MLGGPIFGPMLGPIFGGGPLGLMLGPPIGPWPIGICPPICICPPIGRGGPGGIELPIGGIMLGGGRGLILGGG